ncbi:zinc finger protein 596-like [Puntigrus tetrazona]|uniref:zinc finger protein 596-like n=1 Tax=Puntigrus tetrazona TaxID=1606681 RepID=UPI001C89B0FF|nr:zinc finger protein 596-like [Puntigrus tetrazona]
MINAITAQSATSVSSNLWIFEFTKGFTREKSHTCARSAGRSLLHPERYEFTFEPTLVKKPHECKELKFTDMSVQKRGLPSKLSALCQLKQHQQRHKGKKHHRCTECGKAFAHLYLLRSHRRGHSEERPHSCTECGEGFPRSFDLKMHVNTHSEARPNLSSECGKSFRELRMHLRVHTGEKPYPCSVCGMGFKHTSQLRVLEHTHAGERPL